MRKTKKWTERIGDQRCKAHFPLMKVDTEDSRYMIGDVAWRPLIRMTGFSNQGL